MEIVNQNNYQAFKQQLDAELNRAAEGFVKIGFLLKRARDTNILAESGYKSVTEFAKTEYGLTADVVSRYIAINDRFAEGGYAEELAEQYRNYGLAKLQEMLTLPAPIIEELTPELTRDEIQTIKREYKEEQDISDIEVAIEAAEQETDEINISLNTNLEKILYEYFAEFPSEYVKCDIFHVAPHNIAEHIAPSGQKVIISRIKGVGKLMLTLKSKEQGADIVNMRTGEKGHHTWDEVYDALCKLFLVDWDIDDINERYREIYKEELPKEAVSEPEKKKEKKVSVVKPKKQEQENKKEKQEDKEQAAECAEDTEDVQEAEETKEEQDEEEPIYQNSELDRISELYDEYIDAFEQSKAGIRQEDIGKAKAMYEKAGDVLEQILRIIDMSREDKEDD